MTAAPTPPKRKYLARPVGSIGGVIGVPGDKSISHRALLFGGIAEGVTEIHGFLASEDCLSTLAALRALGVAIEQSSPTDLRVHGRGAEGLQRAAHPLDMGNAGTAMRLSMGLLAAQRFDSTLIGDASLMRRPMERVAGPLREMGASITTQNGRPPVFIEGGRRLRAVDHLMTVASAQVKSALLIAGLFADGRTRVTEPAPSRDHTERMLAGFGVEVLRSGATVALEGGQTLTATHIDVPGDFSSAAFFLVAGALAADRPLVLRGIGVNPTRTGLLDLLIQMGADIRVTPHAGGAEPTADIEVRRSRLRGLRVPESVVPLAIDEFPVFFIAAACADGDSLVRGAAELRVKESDRLAVMSEGLTRLGVEHELLQDGMWIRGGKLSGGSIDSHGDHRVAMAFAVASLAAESPIEILDVANVATSFPGFVSLAASVGLDVEESLA